MQQSADMNNLLSQGNLITVAGGVLTVVGAVAYGSGNANLSLPTIFYGIPILLGGLALKSSELPPAKRVTPASQLKNERAAGAPELAKLLSDVTRWRYGQKAHLESSLEALKLWNEDEPPQLLEIEELHGPSGYGLRLRFERGKVPLEQWQEKQERLGRFFAKGLQAQITALGSTRLDLTLLPVTGEHGQQ
jgi:hypothetical protein